MYGITFRATGMKVGLAVNPSAACIAEWGMGVTPGGAVWIIML